MVPAVTHPRLALALVFVLAALRPTEGGCSRDQIECNTGETCIYKHTLCDGQSNCPDGSDEARAICKFWPPKHHNCRSNTHSVFYYSGGCRNVNEMCTNHGWSSDLDPRICKIYFQDKLQPQQEKMSLSNELVVLLSSAVNSTLEHRKPDCPMLYTRVGKDCLSFFSPARVSWPEARHFCRNIHGDLWRFTDIAAYETLLAFIRKEQFTSDYWIGGRFDLDTNAWSWTTDDTVMPLGAPYWTLKHADSCVRRGPPHTDPFSDPPEALPGARCYPSELSPRERAAGWCAAMTFENYYYWSDELCDEAFSPLCVFTGPAAAREADDN
uniref:LDLa domain-containing C-type lectin n=1 Tax=Eriocheir sinensis TaxID=95602 RepID=V5TF79_ERISI|nr:LDLa domain-containing C-type lectin [Eriocheir sinensis]